MTKKTMWKVTAGRGNAYVDRFLEDNMVAIGWSGAGDYTGVTSRAALRELFQTVYPDDTPRQIDVGAGQVWRFLGEMRPGDDVVTYDPQSRLYHRGAIKGPPRYRPDVIADLPTQRDVQWLDAISRDELSAATRNTLGAIMTLFLLSDDAATELRGNAGASQAVPDIPGAAPIESEADPYDAMSELALERTKDRISRLSWDEMQELVAAMLRALGYRTLISPMGPDRGKDIIASRDGFGFERPRIVVEVKHRKGAMGAQEIRSFLGGRHADDRGLYVSTGGFTKDALYEAERASTVTHLMTLDGLARAVIEQYDKMDDRGRRLLPMTRMYWPE